MSADRKEDDFMNGITITVTKATTVPQYGRTAAGLLAAARNFYQDPENEKAYLEWKARKEGMSDVAVSGNRVRAE